MLKNCKEHFDVLLSADSAALLLLDAVKMLFGGSLGSHALHCTGMGEWVRVARMTVGRKTGCIVHRVTRTRPTGRWHHVKSAIPLDWSLALDIPWSEHGTDRHVYILFESLWLVLENPWKSDALESLDAGHEWLCEHRGWLYRAGLPTRWPAQSRWRLRNLWATWRRRNITSEQTWTNNEHSIAQWNSIHLASGIEAKWKLLQDAVHFFFSDVATVVRAFFFALWQGMIVTMALLCGVGPQLRNPCGSPCRTRLRWQPCGRPAGPEMSNFLHPETQCVAMYNVVYIYNGIYIYIYQ